MCVSLSGPGAEADDAAIVTGRLRSGRGRDGRHGAAASGARGERLVADVPRVIAAPRRVQLVRELATVDVDRAADVGELTLGPALVLAGGQPEAIDAVRRRLPSRGGLRVLRRQLQALRRGFFAAGDAPQRIEAGLEHDLDRRLAGALAQLGRRGRLRSLELRVRFGGRRHGYRS